MKGSLLFPREQYDLAIFRTEETPSVLCQMTVDRISCYMGYPLRFHHGELLEAVYMKLLYFVLPFF